MRGERHSFTDPITHKVVSSWSCWQVDTAGLGGELKFDPGPTTCGDIKDGVGFLLPDSVKSGGWFTIPFSELKDMVQLAERAREEGK